MIDPKTSDKAFLYYASDSYSSRAKVLEDSLEKFHPDWNRIRIKPSHDPGIGNYIQGMAKERLQAVLNLLQNGYEQVIMIGADCVLYQPMEGFMNCLDYESIVLVPHTVNPLPDRKFMGQLYQTGHANADLVGFTNHRVSIDCLKWLISVTEGHEPRDGIFYEQTWLSAVPFLFDSVAILRHPGYNVGWWNANKIGLQNGSNVPLLAPDGTWTVEWGTIRCPLVMVQFSGFIKGHPELMSKYAHETCDGDVYKLFAEYDSKIGR